MDTKDLKNAHAALTRLEELREFYKAKNTTNSPIKLSVWWASSGDTYFDLTEKEAHHLLGEIENDLTTTLKAYGVEE